MRSVRVPSAGASVTAYADCLAASPRISVSATFARAGEDDEDGDDNGDDDEKGDAPESALGPVQTETVVVLPGKVVSTRTTLPTRPSASSTRRRSFMI